MTFTRKDKIALLVAILLSAGFAYVSMLAGYGGLLIGGFYGIVLVPLIVLHIADQRRLLVWQVCIVPFALLVVLENARLGTLGIAGAFGVFYVFWVIGTVISSPVPIFLYWKRSKGRARHRVVWLFLGLVFIGMVCSLWQDPFLFFGLALLWIVFCLVKFAWERSGAAEPHGVNAATRVTLLVFVLTISLATVMGISFKQQAFRSAISHRYLRLGRLFHAIGADPNGRNAYGQTALIDAVWNGVGDFEAVNALIAMGVDVDQQQAGRLSGMLPSGTALHVAAAAGRTKICQALLQAGASVDAKNQKGATPLVVALSRGTIDCVPTLLAYGADVNARDWQGRTPLMLLMNFAPDNPPVVPSILRELLAKGADVTAKDFNGKTAEDWAVYYKHEGFTGQLRSLRESSSKDKSASKSR